MIKPIFEPGRTRRARSVATDVVNGHIRFDNVKQVAMNISMKRLKTGKVTMEGIVTDYPFEKINEAFTDLSDKKEGLFKANLVMG